MEYQKPYQMFARLFQRIQKADNQVFLPDIILQNENFCIQLCRPESAFSSGEESGIKLLYILRGNLAIQIEDGEQQLLSTGSLMLIDMHTNFSFSQWTADCLIAEITLYAQYLRISLTGRLISVDRISSFIYSALNHTDRSSYYILFDLQEVPQVGFLICYLFEEALRADASFFDMSTALLMEIMVELDRLLASEPERYLSGENKDKQAFRILTYIVHHQAMVTLHDLAEVFGYTPNYISQLIYSAFGRRFQQIVHEVRIINAAQLLANTSMPINAVCSTVGYANSSFFYKLFTKYLGVSPMEYRKMALAGKPLPPIRVLLNRWDSKKENDS